MPDVFSKAKRSEVMSHITGNGNKDTELAMIKIFKKFHVRGWRRNVKLFGKPDFVFPSMKLAVFVDGCFWHSCPKHSKVPSANKVFWFSKLSKNVVRDKEVKRVLMASGWRVLRIWEHDLSNKGCQKLFARLSKAGLC